MNLNALKKFGLGLTIAALTLIGSAHAADKTYTENEFLDSFSGESQKMVLEVLGKPAKKQLSVKPSNAEKVTGKSFKGNGKSKPVKVEMFYYNNIVRYDPKHTYKETEITFVNGRVMNIAFFNNR